MLLSALSLIPGALDQNGGLSDYGAMVATTSISAAISIILFLLSRLCSPLFSSSYSSLTLEDRRNWDTRYASMLHAITITGCAYHSIVTDDVFIKDDPTPVLLRTSQYTYMALGLSLGYFLVDWACCLYYNADGVAMLLHHTGAAASVFLAAFTGQCHKATLWMLATEATTPFVNMRYWLEKWGLKNHPSYLVNGVCIMVSWMVFRLALFPPYFVWLWSLREELVHITQLNKTFLIGFPIVLTCLNTFWFGKIVSGGIKAFSKSMREEPIKEE